MKRLLLILFCILIGLKSSMASTNKISDEKLMELLEQANEFEAQNNFESAISIYNEALKIASENKLSSDSSYIYKKIGLVYYKLKQYNSSKIQFKNSILKDSYSKNAADSYFNLCLIYRKEKTKDSLYWALSKSLKIYKTLSDGADKYSTYSKAGILYKKGGQYDKAITYLLKAYDGFSKIEDINKRASISGNIADVQRVLGNLDISKIYYQEQLTLTKRLSDT